MSQTINISGSYHAGIRWSVELPEGRTWDDVASAHIKWDTLTIVWKDGSDDQLFMTFSDEETDSKRPISFTVLDEDYDETTQVEGSDWYAGEEQA